MCLFIIHLTLNNIILIIPYYFTYNISLSLIFVYLIILSSYMNKVNHKMFKIRKNVENIRKIMIILRYFYYFLFKNLWVFIIVITLKYMFVLFFLSMLYLIN